MVDMQGRAAMRRHLDDKIVKGAIGIFTGDFED
jgi:hypothetical protein